MGRDRFCVFHSEGFGLCLFFILPGVCILDRVFARKERNAHVYICGYVRRSLAGMHATKVTSVPFCTLQTSFPVAHSSAVRGCPLPQKWKIETAALNTFLRIIQALKRAVSEAMLPLQMQVRILTRSSLPENANGIGKVELALSQDESIQRECQNALVSTVL